MLHPRSLRFGWFFLSLLYSVVVFVVLVSVVVGYSLIGEHWLGGLADSASSHPFQVDSLILGSSTSLLQGVLDKT